MTAALAEAWRQIAALCVVMALSVGILVLGALLRHLMAASPVPPDPPLPTDDDIDEIDTTR
jgi:hypothetical protein